MALRKELRVRMSLKIGLSMADIRIFEEYSLRLNVKLKKALKISRSLDTLLDLFRVRGGDTRRVWKRETNDLENTRHGVRAAAYAGSQYRRGRNEVCIRT